MTVFWRRWGWTVAVLAGLGGCDRWNATGWETRDPQGQEGEPWYARPVAKPATPHEAYARELARRDSAEAARWRGAGEALLRLPFEVEPLLEERLWFEPGRVDGVAYAFELTRGRRLQVELDGAFDGFVELFAADEAAGEAGRAAPRRVAGSEGAGLQHVVTRTGRYVLRLHPERGFSEAVTVRLETKPSLAFPVRGKDWRAVQSFFGAPRERGRRSHHGIDIFAPRGTETLAARDGIVLRVGVNRLGGNVVWLRGDEGGEVYYYAHLQDALVQPGQRVRAGEPVGRVGTSGNAKGGAPHLHFGIYHRGPIDPFPYVHDRQRRPAPVGVDTDVLGRWMRMARSGPLREAPTSRASAVEKLDRGSALLPIALRGTWARVELPGGGRGWVPASRLQPIERPLSVFRADAPLTLFEEPQASAKITTVVAVGRELEVLARRGADRWVRTPEGEHGWLLATVPEAAG